jgi:single-strand DNA-binding protein
MKMDVGGRIQTSTCTDKNGNTVYATDVVCDDVEFGESKSASQHQEAPKEKAEDDFMTVDDSDIDSLPFS